MKSAVLVSVLGLTLAVGSVALASGQGSDDPTRPSDPGPVVERRSGGSLAENGDFEDGGAGWEVVAPNGRVAYDETGRDGTSGLVVTATEDTRVSAVYDVGGAPLPSGSQVRAVVSVRGSRVGQAVRLTLEQVPSTGAVEAAHETVRTYDQDWEPAQTTAVLTRTGSRLRLRVDVDRLPAGATIRVDDARVSRVTDPVVPVTPSSERLDNGCAVSARGVPACSAYFGAAYRLNDDPSAWEASLGRPLGVRRTYFAADQVDSALQTVRDDLAAGRLPWISFKLPYSWKDMALGRGDQWVLALSRQLSQVPGPVWLAFHHEPEGDGEMSQWTGMQQRLAPMVRATAPNVAYTIILTGWNQLHGPAEYRFRSIWPQGTKVDVAGFDLYNFHGVHKDGQVHPTTPMARQYFDPLSRWARQQGVAWAVAETGYTDTAARDDPAWLYRTYEQLLARGGVAFTYFNSTANSIASWALTTPEKQRQFEYAIGPTPRR